MRILLDECLPSHFSRAFPAHEVTTVKAMGWAGKGNGELLTAMRDQDFPVLLTVDKNLRYQQNLPKYGVSIIVLHALSNRLVDLLPFVALIEAILEKIAPGNVVELTL